MKPSVEVSKEIKEDIEKCLCCLRDYSKAEEIPECFEICGFSEIIDRMKLLSTLTYHTERCSTCNFNTDIEREGGISSHCLEGDRIKDFPLSLWCERYKKDNFK